MSSRTRAKPGQPNSIDTSNYAAKIVIADVAIVKACRDTKFLTKKSKAVVPSAIEWITDPHWVEDDEKRVERTWVALKEKLGKFSSA